MNIFETVADSLNTKINILLAIIDKTIFTNANFVFDFNDHIIY